MSKTTQQPIVIAISGASGLIGSALAADLLGDGHRVLRMVRRPPQNRDEIQWNPQTKQLDPAALSGVAAVVHLAGAGVGDRRWTAEYKREIMDSRVLGTQTVAAAMAQSPDGPRVLVSGSAIGIYGDAGDAELNEQAPVGKGFLADVVQQWEGATQAAAAAGVRVALARTGLVAAPNAGAFAKLLPTLRMGIGGPLGNGKQYWSAISLRDEVRALRFLIEQPLHGPVNLAAPAQATNAEYTHALASALHRPALFPVPRLALQLAVGQFAGEILASQRVVPRVLLGAGFEFRDATVAAIVAEVMHPSSTS